VDPTKGFGWIGTLKQNLGILGTIPEIVMTGHTSPPDLNKAPKATVPEVQRSKSDVWPEASRVKIRYGPFRVPRSSEKNFNWLIFSTEGSASSMQSGVKKPCDNECTLLGLVADIEYADGSSANMSNKVR
jgi:hypothetical protein